jgi:hypothetical protein
MARLARWHIWLGWVAAVPLILWTVSGLWMVSQPIEDVRGAPLRAEPAQLPSGFRAVPPVVTDQGPEAVTLISRVDRPVWVVRYPGNRMRTADGATGAWLARVDARLAERIANAALRHPGRVDTIAAFAAVDAPLELRKDRPSWRVAYDDGLHVYVDAVTGEVLAVRSRQWRAFDFMWGLHIMDLESREDTHHPLLIIAAISGLLSILAGATLLFRRRRS